MKRVKFFSAKNIAYFGVLTALEVVLLFFGSAVPVGSGGASLNFSLLPIVIGAILLGPFAGGILGLISGIVISIMVVTGLQGPVFLYLFQAQPFMIILICLLKTTAAGVVSGWLHRLIKRKNGTVAGFVSALSAPIVNTALFILGCLCISGAVEDSALEFGLGYGSAFSIIILVFVTYNFFIEFAINLVFAPALCTIVRVMEKQIGTKQKKERADRQDKQSENIADSQNKAESGEPTEL